MSVGRDYPRERPRLLPRRRQTAAELDLKDLQGNLVRGYTYPVGAYVFVGVADAARGRAWLRGLVDQVTTAEPWGPDGAPETTLNLSFTYTGLVALGVDAALLATFPEDFREGMAARAHLLGDIGESAPEHWEAGLGTGEAHVLVTLYGIDEESLERARAELEASFDEAVTVVHEQRSETLPEGRDHFGFKDGIAQPALKGSGAEPRPGDGLPNPAGGWRELAPGEFILGYHDEDGGLPLAPMPPFDCNSTYVVYRKMQMHPGRMRAYLQRIANGRDPDVLAAKLVGRWQDGTPLVSSPHGPDPGIANDPARVNDFRYAGDPQGMACPIGAHVRRANPRDDDGFFGGKLSDRHRIIRRGRAYGPPLADDVLEDDGEDRGLIFKCYQADIERQFEMIQSLWIDDGDSFGVGDDKDPIIGLHSEGGGRMIVQGRPPVVMSKLPTFVTVRGGEYLVRPGVRALRWLARP